MKLEDLRLVIESYPHRLYEALEAIDKAERDIEHINEQIEEEEAKLSSVEEDNINEQNNEDIQEVLVRLDHELALLDVRCEQIRGEVELEYRRNPPIGDKVTEATVNAYVKSSVRFVEAKEQYLKKKLERETANITRRVGYTTGLAERRATQHSQRPTSSKLEKLQERLCTAEISLATLEMRLEEVKASILPYQLLVQLYTAGLIK
jgi:chromosome segregation ATPase